MYNNQNVLMMASKLTKYLVEFSEFNLTRPVSDSVRWLEIVAVVLTAVGKFIFMDILNIRLPFVAVVVVAWSGYVIYRYKKDKNVLKDWGFRLDNFKTVLKYMLPFAIVSIVGFVIIGSIQGTINVTWHILPLLITYPIWGSIQQFITIGLIAGNLNQLKSVKLHKTFIVVITAVLFSIVHYPSVWLMIGTFILALFYGYVYLKSKNIYVMGLFHGWLGALFYYTVVNKDPFEEVFLSLMV